ncbi:hypothetical protein J7T55_011838 [Diaporthe amygdali]|uniref:uncharacterized protein n=1 Tax=Phomopsis amygdali TaxID=1214568 RepID=UPI0022FDFC9C|nr:uncharacterized protein J7T55_011838 [Diaporthe amygdali]KAJ0123373.1 hypothetical protein J7T55_011838 [Diaporthe amygdali]
MINEKRPMLSPQGGHPTRSAQPVNWSGRLLLIEAPLGRSGPTSSLSAVFTPSASYTTRDRPGSAAVDAALWVSKFSETARMMPFTVRDELRARLEVRLEALTRKAAGDRYRLLSKYHPRSCVIQWAALQPQ